MKVEIHEDWSRAEGLAGAWSALPDGGAPEDPFSTFEWHDALRAAHHRGQPSWTVVGSRDGTPVAIWPLHLDRRRLGGVLPWRTLSDGGAWYVPHNGIACSGSPAETVATLLDRVLELPGWDELVLHSLVEDGPWHRAFADGAGARGLALAAEPAHRSPFLPLEGSWEEYLAACKSKFRSDLRRCARSLDKRGTVEHRRIDGADAIREAYPAVLEIERASWKHDAGSAITSRDWESRFYERLLAGAAPRGWIQLGLTLVDGRPAAHDIGIVFGKRYACLKTSFVEEFRATNIGKVLRQFVVEGLFERGFAEHDFLGEDEPWKTQWTGRVRPHVNLTLFRSRWRARLVSALRGLRTAARRTGGESNE